MIRIFCITLFLLGASLAVAGQSASNEQWPFPDRRRDDESRFIKEMLSKQQTEREKKEYAALLERGEEALQLSEQLEETVLGAKKLSSQDLERLEEYEKLIKKIRDDLGGDDDGEAFLTVDGPAPKNRRDALQTLRKSTARLVDEIKKSTRFGVSVAAIEGSNALIRLARFVRIKN